MSLRSVQRDAFAPVFRALSDTWLQIRAKPVLYLFLWAILSLAPAAVLSQVLSRPIVTNLTAFMESAQYLGSSVGETLELPPEMVKSFFRLLGLYGVILGITSLTTVYYGAVLSGTIGRFRQQVLPYFSEALADGVSRYAGFLKSVLMAAWKILWKPTAVFLAGSVLGVISRQELLSSVGFFCGLFLTFSGLYRYGLGPFIHLSVGLNSRESCIVSREFYSEHRPVVSSLFLVLIFLPFLAVLVLLSILMSTGAYMGAGGILLWLFQSLIQFMAMMALINFAMNTFEP